MLPGLTRQQLRAMILIAGTFALVVAVYWSSYAQMAELWNQSSYRHGTLIFPISAYLIWRQRDRIAAATVQPWPWGIPILLLLVLFWLISSVLSIQVFEHAAAIAMVPAAVVTFLGVDFTRRILFPVLFLLLAVPFGDALIPYLMIATADLSVGLLNMVGTPVLRQGQFISLPGGEFEVADVCSGLRYLTAGTILALLFSYLTYTNVRNRIIFVVATATTLMLANGVRAFVVMYVASATDLRYFAGKDHVYFGWLLFGLVLIAGFWIGARFADSTESETELARKESTSADKVRITPLILASALVMLAVTARPLEKEFGQAWILILAIASALAITAFSASVSQVNHKSGAQVSKPGRGGSAMNIMTVFLAITVIGAGPTVSGRALDTSAHDKAVIQLPGVASCDGPIAWAQSWYPNMQPPDAEVAGTYVCSEHEVSAFSAYYANDSTGSELISSANEITPHDWRRFVVRRIHHFDDAGGGQTDVVEIEVEAPTARLLIWYWYAVDERTATGSLSVKLLQVWQFLTSGRSDGSVYLLETKVNGTTESSRSRLAKVAREMSSANITQSDQHEMIRSND